MAVRTKQLAADGFSDTSTHTLYTCPSGFRTIIKSIVTQNSAGASNRAVFTLATGATAFAFFAAHMAALGSDGETSYLQPWIVLEAGQSLEVAFFTAGGWVTVSGAELLL